MVGEAAIQELKKCLRGELLRPSSATYDEARKIYNAMIDKRPALIARCAGVADVIRCVNFARQHQLVLSVCGGGHNVAGKALVHVPGQPDAHSFLSVKITKCVTKRNKRCIKVWNDFIFPSVLQSMYKLQS